MRSLFLTVFCAIVSLSQLIAQIPTFPKAQGFGSLTSGGRGGVVIKVTNLNDSGPGSLRAAIEENQPRIIIFTVGGIINLKTALIINHPYVTIAGQSAPGDGICLRGQSLVIKSHDVVVRYLRIRPGSIDFGPTNKWDDVDALTIAGNAEQSYNIVIDHCSLSWAVDENIGIWGAPHDITIQDCIISQALNHSKHPKGSHGMGMLIGGKSTNISIHHNLFAHNNDRNPHINGFSFVDFRNNLIYNPGGRATDIGAKNGQIINYLNNYIKKGPNTNIPADIVVRNLKNQFTKLHISGNVGVGNIFKETYYSDDREEILLNKSNDSFQNFFDNLPDPYPAPLVNTMPASQAYEYILQEAGANLPKRDAVDREIIKDVKMSRGKLVNSKDHILEWPPFQSGLPFSDSDNDGMPDYWEERYGLNSQTNESAEDKDGDGYTNIEEFLNKTDPNRQETSTSSNFLTLGEQLSESTSYAELNLEIEQNYPNPYSDETHIKFSVDKSTEIVIKVIDNNGKEIVELINAFLYEGKYHILWDSSNVDPGMYQIFIASKDEVKSIKTILSR